MNETETKPEIKVQPQKFLRIIQQGWEAYTGPLYGITFENGVSVDGYSAIQAAQVAGTVQAEEVIGDKTHNPSVSQEILNWKNRALDQDMVRQASTGELVKSQDLKTDLTPVKIAYSRAQLEAIADEKGIAGIREITDPLNIKSTSIGKLIEEVLKLSSDGPYIEAQNPNEKIGGHDADKDWSKEGKAKDFVQVK